MTAPIGVLTMVKFSGVEGVPARTCGGSGGSGGGGDGSGDDGSAGCSALDFCCCWRRRRPLPAATIVFPPCNTDELQQLPLAGRARTIVSIAQFRPEKDHALQLRAFALFRARDADAFGDVVLQLIGGVRDAGDAARVAALRALAGELGLPPRSVEFHENAPFPRLRALLAAAACTLHTMWNEHFGIVVVESLAAGAVTIAHRSGGPLADIVVPWGGQRTGFLAASAEEYADALETIFRADAAARASVRAAPGARAAPMSAKMVAAAAAAAAAPEPAAAEVVDLLAIASAGRASAARFSDAEFARTWGDAIGPLLRRAAADKAGRAW